MELKYLALLVLAALVTLGVMRGVVNDDTEIRGTSVRTVDRYLVGRAVVGDRSGGVAIGDGDYNAVLDVGTDSVRASEDYEAGQQVSEEVQATGGALLPSTWVDQVICSYSWDCGTALSVSSCESGDDRLAEDNHSSGARGTFQIHPIHEGLVMEMGYTWGDMLEVGPNVAVAYQLYSGGGWYPWISCL